MGDNIETPNINTKNRDIGPLKRKKIIASHLVQAVQAAK